MTIVTNIPSNPEAEDCRMSWFDHLGWWYSLSLMLAWAARECLIRNRLAQAEATHEENDRLLADNEALEAENQRLIAAAALAMFDLWWLSENATTAATEQVQHRSEQAYNRIETSLKPLLAANAKAGGA